jgi:hypothetical protein
MSERPGTVVGAGMTWGAGFSWAKEMASVANDNVPTIMAIGIAGNDLGYEIMQCLLE